jgi:hypothetical protein
MVPRTRAAQPSGPAKRLIWRDSTMARARFLATKGGVAAKARHKAQPRRHAAPLASGALSRRRRALSTVKLGRVQRTAPRSVARARSFLMIWLSPQPRAFTKGSHVGLSAPKAPRALFEPARPSRFISRARRADRRDRRVKGRDRRTGGLGRRDRPAVPVRRAPMAGDAGDGRRRGRLCRWRKRAGELERMECVTRRQKRSQHRIKHHAL